MVIQWYFSHGNFLLMGLWSKKIRIISRAQTAHEAETNMQSLTFALVIWYSQERKVLPYLTPFNGKCHKDFITVPRQGWAFENSLNYICCIIQFRIREEIQLVYGISMYIIAHAVYRCSLQLQIADYKGPTSWGLRSWESHLLLQYRIPWKHISRIKRKTIKPIETCKLLMTSETALVMPYLETNVA